MGRANSYVATELRVLDKDLSAFERYFFPSNNGKNWP